MDMEDGIYRLIAMAGFFIVLLLAWGTGARQTINRKTVFGSLTLIWFIGALVFWFPPSRTALKWINDGLVALLSASQKGSQFLFGPLALGPGQSLPDGTTSIGFVLAMQVLPAVIFFSALVSALYYLDIMPAIVRTFGKLFHKTMNLSGAESLSASANIFVGIESSLTVKPWLANMTRSELLTLLTCMMATVASTVLGVYVIALIGVFPQIAGHLVSASVISIPCAVLVSKLSLPETQSPETLGTVPEESRDTSSERPANLMVALIDGGQQGARMAVGIATLLIVVLGLEALVDLILSILPEINNQSISVSRILGWLAWPFVVLLGLRPEEWQAASQILGSRFVETEVTAYFSLGGAQSANPPAFSPRSFTAMSYALCGFVHFASLGIFIGGLAALIPDRMRELSLLGMRALWTAFLATLLTGCVAGVLA